MPLPCRKHEVTKPIMKKIHISSYFFTGQMDKDWALEEQQWVSRCCQLCCILGWLGSCTQAFLCLFYWMHPFDFSISTACCEDLLLSTMVLSDRQPLFPLIFLPRSKFLSHILQTHTNHDFWKRNTLQRFFSAFSLLVFQKNCTG